jgi:hypothetical protein
LILELHDTDTCFVVDMKIENDVEKAEGEEDYIGPDGVGKFLTDLEVDPEDVRSSHIHNNSCSRNCAG